MTEEIRYIANLQRQEEFDNEITELKDELKRLEQENKNFEILAKSLYKRIEELEKENEALAFRERLYKADYEASEQENKELKEKLKKIYRLSYIAYDKILNSTEVSYGLNEIIDIQKIIKDDKTIYYEISTCDTEHYRSALEEIKSIAQDAIDRKFTSNSLDYSEGQECIGYYVMEKINEVLGND